LVLEKKFSKKTPGIPLIPFLYSLILVFEGKLCGPCIAKKQVGCTKKDLDVQKCTFSGFSGHYKKEEEKKRE